MFTLLHTVFQHLSSDFSTEFSTFVEKCVEENNYIEV